MTLTTSPDSYTLNTSAGGSSILEIGPQGSGGGGGGGGGTTTSSALRTAALAVPQGTFSLFESNLTVADVTDASISTITWSDSAGWDPINEKIRFVGKRASTFNHRLLQYDLATNAWTMTVEDTEFGTTGHGYDANACDPATGDHYFLASNSKTVKKYSPTTGTWSSLPQFPNTATAAMSLTWLNTSSQGPGLLMVTHGDHGAAFYNPTAGTWTNLDNTGGYPASATPWGDYHVISEYNPVHNVTLIGGGNTANTVIYKMDSNFNFTLLNAAPINIGSSNFTLVSVDTVSGLYVIVDKVNQTWWHYDITLDTWEQITHATTPPTIQEGAFQVPIPEFGVICYVTNIGTSPPAFYIYRPVNAPIPAETQAPLGDYIDYLTLDYVGYDVGQSTYPTHVPHVTAMYFSQGVVPSGEYVLVAGGPASAPEYMPTQTDVWATWPDGSIKHCGVSFSTGTDANRNFFIYKTDTNYSGAGAATRQELIDYAEDLKIELVIGGTTWTATLQDALAATASPTSRRAGGFCSEFVDVKMPFKNGATEHPHLDARFYVTAITNPDIAQGTGRSRVNQIRCRWAIENTRCFLDRDAASNTFGSFTVTSMTVSRTTDGYTAPTTFDCTILTASSFEIPRQSRISRVSSWDYRNVAANQQYSYFESYKGTARSAVFTAVPGNWETDPTDPMLQHLDSMVVCTADPGRSAALMADGVIPNYIPQAQGSGYDLTSKDGINVLSGLGYRTDMTAGGEHSSIAPLMRADARYFAQNTSTRLASLLKYVWGAANAGGLWHIHARDEGTDMVITIDDYPRISMETSAGNVYFAGSPTSNFPGGLTGYTPDIAHQPSVGFTPYVLSGDYYFLEEMHFWAGYNQFKQNGELNAYRQAGNGYFRNNQLRAFSWSLRTHAHALFLTPDSHAHKTYLTTILENNRAREEQWFITNDQETILGYKTYGGVQSEWGDKTPAISTFQHSFFVCCISLAANMFTEWDLLADLATRFYGLAIRHPQFCEKRIASYYLYVTDGVNTGVDDRYHNYRDMLQRSAPGEVGNCPVNWSDIGYVTLPNAYIALSAAALAYSAERGFYQADVVRQDEYNALLAGGTNLADAPEWTFQPRSIGALRANAAVPYNRWYSFDDKVVSRIADVYNDGESYEIGVFDYSGYLFDTKRDRIVFRGGGHGFRLNGIFSFDPVTGMWGEIHPTTPWDQRVENAFLQGDGQPNALHMYQDCCYIPEPYDKYFFCGAFWWSNAGGGGQPFLYDPKTSTYDLTLPVLGGVGPACWDGENERVWRRVGSQLHYYDPATNTHTERTVTNYSYAWVNSLAYNSDKNELLFTGPTVTEIWSGVDNLATATMRTPSWTGPTGILSSNGVVVIYHPGMRKYIAYNPMHHQTNLYTIDTDTDTITEIVPDAGNTVIPTSTVFSNEFHRMVFDPKGDSLIIAPEPYAPVYAIKLEAK